jgi:hypothetical protein
MRPPFGDQPSRLRKVYSPSQPHSGTSRRTTARFPQERVHGVADQTSEGIPAGTILPMADATGRRPPMPRVTAEKIELNSLRNLMLKELHGSLWHTTHPDRFRRILELGSILPVPDPPNPDGWRTMDGEPYRSYAHTLGAVSLFDFDQFDPESYAAKCPMSSWDTFVPYREKWGSAVWIEIDRKMVAPQFIPGPDLVAKWNSDKAHRHGIMPYIEAVHLGPLPKAAFKRAFLIGKGDTQSRSLDV